MIEDYLSLPYHRILIAEEDGGYTALVLEWPGCISEGNDLNEAMDNLEDAMEGWATAVQAHGRPLPPPIDARQFARIQRRIVTDAEVEDGLGG